MREQTCVFIGHRECYGVSLRQMQEELEKLVAMGVTEFLCGGMGRFDWMCARQIYQMKKRYPQIRCTLVLPYPSLHVFQYRFFDNILYPDCLETLHPKAAIPARNRYMVEHAAYALCYVTHNWGGAAKTYAYAQQQKLTVVNLWNGTAS